MSYSDSWIGSVLNTEWTNYCPYAQMRSFMASLPTSDFSNRPSRTEIRTRLQHLMGYNVVSQTMRFPVALYVQVEAGVVGECLAQLNRCLVYTDHEETSEGRNRYDDVKLQFYSTVARLNTILAQPLSPAAPTYGIFNRQSFERFYALCWEDVPQTAPRRAAGQLPPLDDEHSSDSGNPDEAQHAGSAPDLEQ
nr:MAG: capsid protein [Drosophila Crammond virga-like virus]